MPDSNTKKEFVFDEGIPASSEGSATPRHTLSELLAKCGTNEPLSEEDRAWIDSTSLGRELL
jgi:hypothetical protein